MQPLLFPLIVLHIQQKGNQHRLHRLVVLKQLLKSFQKLFAMKLVKIGVNVPIEFWQMENREKCRKPWILEDFGSILGKIEMVEEKGRLMKKLLQIPVRRNAFFEIVPLCW